MPYLNGGLFEEDEEDRSQEIIVPDESIDIILKNLIYRFNFTVTESTPLDIEIAVDPEMLGKVFEELVTGRHETGSYYTPKPVVSFMCREALKGYLETILPGETPTAIQHFVDDHDSSGLRNSEAVLDALRKVKVCDPACGSGAYLLGMLQELFYLRMCLFAAQSLDSISAYQRKLEIIQNNIYGVDQDPFAANIARLRLWLSLAVEFEGEIPPALPNLDFKIEIGDSLIAPNPRGAAQQAFRGELIGQFRETKDRFIYTHGGEKISLRRHIAEIKEQISQWTHQGDTVYGFDWDVEFAEVFSDGGFDIVLANPPYVRADAQFKHLIDDEEARQAAIAQWKDYRAMLLSSGIFQTLYEKWDLYLPFLERAYYLMRPEGRMVFIISDAYNAAKYARKSHEFFLENAKVVRLDFCSDISLFKAGISNTILHFAKNQPTRTDFPLRVRRWGGKQDDFEINSEVLPTAPQLEMGINTFKPQTIEQQTIKQSINLNNLCYISYGLRANADDRFWQGEFTTDDCLSKIKDNEHPKPFVQGKDLIKWWAYRVYYLEWGTQRAPKKFSRPTFSELHEAKEKLIAVRTPGAEPKVIYDNSQLHFDASCVGFVPWHLLKGVMNKSISKAAKYRGQAPGGDREKKEISSQKFHVKYLLAILNSRFAKEWLAGKRRSKIHIYPDDWKQLPIAIASSEEQADIVEIVDEILLLYSRESLPLSSPMSKKLAELELKINEKLDELYGLDKIRKG